MLKRLLFFFTFFPLLASAQVVKSFTKTELTKLYVQALTDFIIAANKKNNSIYDTLFILKRNNKQSDDFPNINVPQSIEHTQLRLVHLKKSDSRTVQNLKSCYINMMAWLDKETTEFMFVVFSKGFKHLYDCSSYYKYNLKLKKFELAKCEFKEPPFNK